MNPWCYVLIQGEIIGCLNKIIIVGVTQNQQYAYNWQQQADGVTITREARQVAFINVI